ncbi:MAG: class I SAM-dependent methyltransferase [Candidatus Cloacimonetes bacterium]|nr:class I SAM-dependent methyltransferase [Candidatus Cloacimonadota bacterium]
MSSSLKFYKENIADFTKDTIGLELFDNWSIFLKLLQNQAKILDAGCGTGRDSNHFLKKGFEVVSIDPIEDFQKIAKTQFNINILKMSFEDINWIAKFDAIWANASLLHVSHEDHIQVFQRLFNALKPNGILYCSYKYGEGQTLKGQRSFYNFTENSFTEFIHQHKLFEIIQIYKQEDRRPERSHEFWLNCLLKKS